MTWDEMGMTSCYIAFYKSTCTVYYTCLSNCLFSKSFFVCFSCSGGPCVGICSDDISFCSCSFFLIARDSCLITSILLWNLAPEVNALILSTNSPALGRSLGSFLRQPWASLTRALSSPSIRQITPKACSCCSISERIRLSPELLGSVQGEGLKFVPRFVE